MPYRIIAVEVVYLYRLSVCWFDYAIFKRATTSAAAILTCWLDRSVLLRMSRMRGLA